MRTPVPAAKFKRVRSVVRVVSVRGFSKTKARLVRSNTVRQSVSWIAPATSPGAPIGSDTLRITDITAARASNALRGITWLSKPR